MEGTVINNTKKAIQLYLTYTDSTKNLNPNLKDYQGGQLTNVGAQNSADVMFVGSGDYIYCAIWPSTSVTGTSDSWLVVDRKTGKLKTSRFGEFIGVISGDADNGWTITVTDGPGSNNLLLYILLFVFALLFIIGVGVGVFFIIRNRDSGSTSDLFGQQDLPIFVPKY